jgi:hypothetical protein
MLGTVTAVQRRGDLGHTVMATAIPQRRQLLRVAPALQNGADDFEARHAGDVAKLYRIKSGEEVVRLATECDQAMDAYLDVIRSARKRKP